MQRLDDVIGHVDGDSAIVMAGDLGTGVLCTYVVPREGTVALLQRRLKEGNERWMGGKYLSVVNVHDNRTLLVGIGGILTVVYRQVKGSGKWVRRCYWGVESDGSQCFCKADFEEVVGLFEAIQGANYFNPLASEGVWQVVG